MSRLSILPAAFVLSIVASSSTLAAVDNTIRFVGEVSGQTCDISVNNSSTSSSVILMQTAKSSELATPGAVSTPTRFKVSVKNCTASYTADKNIGVAFTSNNVDPSGHLTNMASGSTAAKSVSIKLIDPAGNDINLSPGYSRKSTFTLAKGTTEGEAEYTAAYVSNGQVTAGAVEASVQYAITYL